MNKKTKYFIISKVLLVSIILIIAMSILQNMSMLYRDYLPILFDTLIIIFNAVNTVSIIGLIIGLIYFSYQIYRYVDSSFYKIYKINVFEAIYHGFLDIHIMYDQIRRLADVKELTVDMKKSMLFFSINHKYFCLKFVELFGNINNNIENEMWVSLKQPKKEFGRVNYQKKIKFSNPVRQVNQFIEEELEISGKQYCGYVVLNGIYKLKQTDDQIISSYEIVSTIRENQVQ